MVKIDANQEAIALIRMAVDNNNKSHTLQGQTADDMKDHETDSEVLSPKRHWTFGSRISGTRLDSRALEKQLAPGDDFISFDERLRSFITHYFPEEAPRYEDQCFKCVTIQYQSIEDWTECHDIMRCNPDFHQHERYDCVIINYDSPGTTVARLRSLLRCQLSSGKVIDVALIHSFTTGTKWKPNTIWDKSQRFGTNLKFVWRQGNLHSC